MIAPPILAPDCRVCLFFHPATSCGNESHNKANTKSYLKSLAIQSVSAGSTMSHYAGPGYKVDSR